MLILEWNKVCTSIKFIMVFLSGFLLLIPGQVFSSTETKHLFTTVLLDNYSSATPKSKLIRILSIDGGGVRGIIPLYTLQYLEEQTHQPIYKLFDLIVGVSSGSITAAVLTAPVQHGHPMSVDQFIYIYNQLAQSIFYRSTWYKMTSLGGYAKIRYLPVYRNAYIAGLFDGIKLSELNNNVVFPAFSLLAQSNVLYRSWQAKVNLNDDYYIRDILEGTTSVFMLFPAAKVYNLYHNQYDIISDAAIYMNNPVETAYIEAKALFPNKKYIIVSLGTGRHFVDNAAVPSLVQEHLGFSGVKSIIALSMRAESNLADQYMQEQYHLPATDIVAYFRYTIDIPEENVDPFNINSENLIALNSYGKALVEHNQSTLAELAKILISVDKNTGSI